MGVDMNLQILMATMHRSTIDDLNLSVKNIANPLLVINQADCWGEQQLDDIRMLTTTERGSSKSRNMAIDNAFADYCLMADDDVVYLPGYEKTIATAFEQFPDADVITFQIATPDGAKFNPGYADQDYLHNSRTILRCASIEIVFKRSSIIRAGLRLDERFGLGSKYRVHDEIIFLKDALDKGLKLYYKAVPIVIHPAESSGTNFTEHLIYSKGAAFVRLFGVKGVSLILPFAFKKYPLYKSDYSFARFVKIMLRGALDYRSEYL